MNTSYTLVQQSSELTNKQDIMRASLMSLDKRMDGEFSFQKMVISTKVPFIKIKPVVTNKQSTTSESSVLVNWLMAIGLEEGPLILNAVKSKIKSFIMITGPSQQTSIIMKMLGLGLATLIIKSSMTFQNRAYDFLPHNETSSHDINYWLIYKSHQMHKYIFFVNHIIVT